MLFRTQSAAVYGIDANLVDVEVDLTPIRSENDTPPPVIIVGLPDLAVRESRERIQAQLAPVGVQIQQFGFIGKPRFTAAIEQAITQKTQAITEAERARNQLAVTQAEMAKSVAEAEGEAKSQVARAQGEATSLIARARGEAEANRLRQASITPQLLEWKRLENQRALVDRWNGSVPQTILGEKTNLLMPFPADQK